MLELLFIALIVVFVIDLSGFVPEISKIIWGWIYPKVKYVDWIIPKPFSCSLCSTFWLGIIFLIITHSFSLGMLAYVALLAFLTPAMKELLILVKDSLISFFNVLYELIIK